MHIFISGATGRNGSIALQEALNRGHTVTVLVRNPSSITPHPNLTIIQGTASSQADLSKAITTPTPPSAIITALNPRRTSENPFAPLSPDSPPNLLTSTAQVLLSTITGADLSTPPKIIVNSLFGAGDSFRNLSLPIRFVMSHSTMKITIRDHNTMDEIIRDSGMPFVFARPARLVEGQAMEVKVWREGGVGCGWNPTLTRESLGKWMVKAAESDEWDGESPVLTN